MRSNIFKCIHLISSYPCSEVLRFSLAVGLLDHVFGFVSLELLEECCRHWFGEYGSATVVDNQREPTLSSIPTVHKGASRHHAWNAGWGAGGSEKFRQRWMLVALVPPYLSLLFTLHFQELLTMSGGIPFWCQTSINMDVALKLHFFQIPITSSSDVWGRAKWFHMSQIAWVICGKPFSHTPDLGVFSTTLPGMHRNPGIQIVIVYLSGNDHILIPPNGKRTTAARGYVCCSLEGNPFDGFFWCLTEEITMASFR